MTDDRMREALEKWLRELGPAFDTQSDSVKELTVGLAMPCFRAGWEAALSPPARRTSTEFEVDESGHEVEVLDEWMAQVYDLSGAPLPKKEPRVVVRNRENGRIRMSYRLPWGTIGSGDMGREAAERIATLAGLEKEES